MGKKLKITLIVLAAIVALVVLFNLLPGDIRTTATLCALGGAVVGAVAAWKAKTWYDGLKAPREV